MKVIKSDQVLGEYTKNVGTMFIRNSQDYGMNSAFAERQGHDFIFWTWQQMTNDIFRAVSFLLEQGMDPEDHNNNRVAFIAGNHYQRLVCEMAVMSCGLVSVPIFAGYPRELMSQLMLFSEVSLLISDVPEKVVKLDPAALPDKILWLETDPKRNTVTLDATIAYFDQVSSTHLDEARMQRLQELVSAVDPSQLALIMYTSGTSGFPKGVQLSHSNLMSQQKALQLLWKPQPGMRFLCYLPWHHSFGGLFERFFALHSGGCLAIDDSRGKDVDRLLENIARVRPHVYFSVPKIFQEIVSRVVSSPTIEKTFFHSDLKFVFTAAAPLPISTSDVFKAKKVPVVEGWGLTETSPCCTLTSFDLERQSGVVGFPIPGVEIALGDENEILVRGANVMSGYFKNPQANKQVFYGDGWFKTGDIGDFTEKGVKIISRKERMFKLSNGEKMFPSELEDDVNNRCCYIKYSYVFGSGQAHPFMLVFPNAEMMETSKQTDHSRIGCAKPRDIHALSNCLGKCVRDINSNRKTGFKKIQQALIINRELSLENNQLTPSFKLIPGRVEEHFKEYISAMLEQRYDDLPKDAHVIAIDPLPCESIKNGAAIISPAQKAAIQNLHYAVIGTGPVGRVLAAHLYKSGHQVSVLCHDESAKRELDESPIIVSGELEAKEAIRNIYTDLNEIILTKPDVVLICTKNIDSEALLNRIHACNPSREMLFVSCQNGLDVEEQIVKIFGPGRALRMVLNLGCGMVDSHEVRVSFSMTNCLSKISEVNADLIQQIANDLTSADFATDLDEDYRVAVFKKAILNSSLGSICALTRQTMSFVMAQEEMRNLVKQVVVEGIAIAKVMSIPIEDAFVDEAMNYLSQGGDHKPSILMDIEKGRKTENEYHCEKLAEYAKQYKVDVQVIPVISQLIKTLEMQS